MRDLKIADEKLMGDLFLIQPEFKIISEDPYFSKFRAKNLPNGKHILDHLNLS